MSSLLESVKQQRPHPRSMEQSFQGQPAPEKAGDGALMEGTQAQGSRMAPNELTS